MKQKLYTLCMALLLVCGQVFAIGGKCGNHLKWNLDGNGVLTISGTGAMKDYKYRINKGDYNTPWCSYRDSITSIQISEGVTTIGNHAFDACWKLTSIMIPNSVTSIGNLAFYNCSGLTSVTIPNSVTTIGNEAFWGCDGLTSVTIGNSVTSIGYGAFRGCRSLTSVTIPNSVTSIGDEAFLWCEGLTSVIIPNSVTNIGDYVFSGCTGLTAIYVALGNFNYCSMDGVLYNKNKTMLVQYPAGKTTKEYTIPNSVTNIGKGAFSGCDGLNSVTIPNSFICIGNDAFRGCRSLTSVTIPNSVTSIGDHTFSDCSGLKSVTIPNSVISIGNYAFSCCSGLTSVTIPNSVTSIGDHTFSDCSGLKSVTIPNSVISIGNYAFSCCSGLTSVTIPNSVTSIGSSAFADCWRLKSVTIPNSVTSIGSWAFYKCSGLTSVTIPNSVTSIGSWAFRSCSSLTSVTIGNNVKKIGKNVFEYCEKMEIIKYPKGLNISKAGIPTSAKHIAYSPTNSSTSTATASSRFTSDTNSATTSRTAATQPSTPTTKPVTTPPAKLPECRIEYSKPENIYHSSSIRLCYSVDSELSDNQEIEFLIDGTPVEPKALSQQKGVRPVQCTEVELDNMPTIANHVTKVSIRIVDKRSRISWSEKSIALKYQSIHKPTLHVFAVGVNKYKAKGFDELRYAEKDARDFSKTIIDIADKNMYERVDTTVILGSRANRSYILAQLMKLEGRVKSNDIVMLFFSGHGKVENGKSYFITSDAEYVIQGLATRDIVDQIELMKKRSNVFVFMDACHSGATKTTERTKGNAKPITLAESEVIGYYSCAEKQESIEDENLKNGVFTYALVKGLKGTAANEGQITIHELAEYIRKWVREKTNGRQSPTLDYQGDDYVIFYKKK